MNTLVSIKEIMFCLDEYAVVDEKATILDALWSLENSRAEVGKGRAPPQAVVVKGEKGDIRGMVDHFGLLGGLKPQLVHARDMKTLSRAGLSTDFVASVTQQKLGDIRFDQCVRVAMNRKVVDIMSPVEEQIDIDDGVGELIE
ncbi:MAG: hypothetical protein HN348_32910, partial [Proteobacteria bacterium]|nr:hypothetical protein [Pseudomonadota bacterium]